MNTSLVIIWQSFTATYVFRSSSASSCVLLLYPSLLPPFLTFSVAICSIAESEKSVFTDSITAFLYLFRSLHVNFTTHRALAGDRRIGEHFDGLPRVFVANRGKETAGRDEIHFRLCFRLHGISSQSLL